MGGVQMERNTLLNPTVSIDGAPMLSPVLTEDLVLHGLVDASTCTTVRTPPAYSFAWSVQPAISLDLSTQRSSALFVPATSLLPGTDYLFTLTLTRPDSSEVLSRAVLHVIPRPVPPVPVILGPLLLLPPCSLLPAPSLTLISGGDREVRYSSNITLDGSLSFDPLLGAVRISLSHFCLSSTL